MARDDLIMGEDLLSQLGDLSDTLNENAREREIEPENRRPRERATGSENARDLMSRLNSVEEAGASEERRRRRGFEMSEVSEDRRREVEEERKRERDMEREMRRREREQEDERRYETERGMEREMRRQEREQERERLRPEPQRRQENLYDGVLDRDERRARNLEQGRLDNRNEFLDSPNEYDYDDRRGPLNIDRQERPAPNEQQSGRRRRPVLDDGPEERRTSVLDDGDIDEGGRGGFQLPGFLSNIHLSPKVIAILAVVVVVFVVGAFLDKKQGSTENKEQLNSSNNQVVEEQEKQEEQSNDSDSEDSNKSNSAEKYKTSVAEETVERGILSNDTVVKFSEDVYTDEIAISKFLEFRGASCIPKFVGYSEILEREIEFQVSASDYNKYLNGVKIGVEYRAIERDNITYVTDIKIIK